MHQKGFESGYIFLPPLPIYGLSGFLVPEDTFNTQKKILKQYRISSKLLVCVGAMMNGNVESLEELMVLGLLDTVMRWCSVSGLCLVRLHCP